VPCKCLYWMVLVLLILTGCDNPIFITQPLSDPMTEEPDQTLYGHWVAKGKDIGSDIYEGSELHFFIGASERTAGPAAQPFMEYVVVLWGATKSRAYTESGYMTVSRIGSSSYINVYLLRKDAKDLEHHLLNDEWRYADWSQNKKKLVGIFRYTVQGNRATLWRQSEKVQKKLIESGELKNAKGSDISDQQLVTFDSLFRYLLKNEGAIHFDLGTSLTRVP